MTQGTTKQSPFFLTYGYHANLPTGLVSTAETQGTFQEQLEHRVNKQISSLWKVRQEAQDLITKVQQRQISHFEEKHKIMQFKIGDKVLLKRNYLDTSWSGKLQEKWSGYYYVYNVYPNSTYHLRNQEGKVLVKKVHGNRLKPYLEHLKNSIIEVVIPPKKIIQRTFSKNI